jgi:hypothetical protein
MELASGMGFPPPWGANEDYHFFFKNVKLMENALDSLIPPLVPLGEAWYISFHRKNRRHKA